MISLPTQMLAKTQKDVDFIKKEIPKACGFSGNVMAKKQTQKEWQKSYEMGRLSSVLIEYCPKLAPIKESSITDVYDFLYEYARDSGKDATCY